MSAIPDIEWFKSLVWHERALIPDPDDQANSVDIVRQGVYFMEPHVNNRTRKPRTLRKPRSLRKPRRKGMAEEPKDYWMCIVVDIRKTTGGEALVLVEWLYKQHDMHAMLPEGADESNISDEMKPLLDAVNSIGVHERVRSNFYTVESVHTIHDSVDVYEFNTEKVDMPLMFSNEYYQRYYADIIDGGRSAEFPTGLGSVCSASCPLDNVYSPVDTGDLRYCCTCQKWSHEECSGRALATRALMSTSTKYESYFAALRGEGQRAYDAVEVICMPVARRHRTDGAPLSLERLIMWMRSKDEAGELERLGNDWLDAAIRESDVCADAAFAKEELLGSLEANRSAHPNFYTCPLCSEGVI